MVHFRLSLWVVVSVVVFGVLSGAGWAAEGGESASNARRPTSEAELRYWLTNMVVHHGFSVREVTSATGMSAEEARAAIERLGLDGAERPKREPGDPLTVLPYPGGRHPRIGFLEGAIEPQRETKVSVFTPWDPDSYVVVDVPEAIRWQHGILYLAHTHVPTAWTERGVELEKLEWVRRDGGGYHVRRRLPNGVSFYVGVDPRPDAVYMEMLLTNGSEEPLSAMMVQNCVMLRGAKGFTQQNNENLLRMHPYAARSNAAGGRWVITAWQPCIFLRGNERVPCVHSDPILPNAAPGEQSAARGYLWFYEGTDIEGEIERLAERTGWAVDPDPPRPGEVLRRSRESQRDR